MENESEYMVVARDGDGDIDMAGGEGIDIDSEQQVSSKEDVAVEQAVWNDPFASSSDESDEEKRSVRADETDALSQCVILIARCSILNV